MIKWAGAWQNQQNEVSPVWSESSLCAQWIAKDLTLLHMDIEDWSDWAVVQADLSDLSLCWVHRSFFWVCHVFLCVRTDKFSWLFNLITKSPEIDQNSVRWRTISVTSFITLAKWEISLPKNLNSVSSQCARGKSSLAWKSEVHSKFF